MELTKYNLILSLLLYQYTCHKYLLCPSHLQLYSIRRSFHREGQPIIFESSGLISQGTYQISKCKECRNTLFIDIDFTSLAENKPIRIRTEIEIPISQTHYDVSISNSMINFKQNLHQIIDQNIISKRSYDILINEGEKTIQTYGVGKYKKKVEVTLGKITIGAQFNRITMESKYMFL